LSQACQLSDTEESLQNSFGTWRSKEAKAADLNLENAQIEMEIARLGQYGYNFPFRLK
jgi:hypothetical protein